MKPVDQTIFGMPNGDCLRACVASLLELEIDEVPNFMDCKAWDEVFEEFMARYGLQPIELEWTGSPRGPWWPIGYHLAVGKTPRGDLHSVIAYQGEVVHDPHPARTGLEKVEAWMFFVATFEDGKSHSSNVGAGWLGRAVKGE